MFLTKIDNYYSSKNKLEEAILAMLQTYSRLLVKGSQVKTIQKEIEARIAILNDQHKRCKPFTCHWNVDRRKVVSDYDHALNLSPSTVADFRIYAASKGEYTPVEVVQVANQKAMF